MKLLLKLILVLPILTFAQPVTDGVYFDGVDDQLIVPFTTNINSTVTKNRTYETYFKVVSTTNRQIIMKEGAGVRAVIMYVENGYLILGAYNRADYTPKWQGTFYRVPINANQWYHVALVFDNAQKANNSTNPMNATANTALKFYLDGVSEAENSGYQFGKHNSLRLGYKNEGLRFPNCGTWSQAVGNAEYCFGTSQADGGGGEYYYKGNLWGFRVWNDVRTPSEILSNKEKLILTVGTDDLVAALDGDTLTYTDSNGNTVDTSVNNQTVYVWKTNAVTTSWTTDSNWQSDSAPVSNTLESVRIPAGASKYPEIDSYTVVGNVTIDDGAQITVKSDGIFEISYDLTNNGTLKIDNNGSLLVIESKPILGNGIAIVDRKTRNLPADFYTIWSSPVSEADSNFKDIFINDFLVFDWDMTSDPGKWVQLNGANNMKTGVGYFLRPDSSGGVYTRTFTGELNNGDINVPIYYNSPTDNYNIIGNPYPSAIDWTAVYNDNSDLINGTMYYWRHTGFDGDNAKPTDYIAYNLLGSNLPIGITSFISTGLGVSIEAKQPGTLVFRNSQRVPGNNSQFFRTSPEKDKNKMWLELVSSSKRSSILIGFVNGATDAYSSDYDAKNIDDTASLQLYTLLEDEKLTIQGNAALEESVHKSIPLGFHVATAGQYSISIPKEYIDDDYDILLEDTEGNELVKLSEGAYNFYLSKGITNDSRFILHFRKQDGTLSANTNAYEDKLVSYFKGNTLVTSLKSENIKVNNIEVINVSGKKVYSSSFNSKLKIDLPSGIYFVKYHLKEGGDIFVKIPKK